MSFKSPLILVLISAILYGCSSDQSASSQSVSGMQLPANVAVLQDDSAVSSGLSAQNNAAFNSAGTDYTNTKGDVFINGGQWQEPMNMADMLICIMNGSMHSSLSNSSFIALVDMSQCEPTESNSAPVTRFAEAVMVSSRTSNSSDQIVKAFFTDSEDMNSDGDTLDTGEVRKFAANTVIKEGFSQSNPYGVFDFNWNLTNAPTGDHSRGSLSFTEESLTQVGISFIEENKETGEYDFDQWAVGVLNKDGSGGKLKVSQFDNGSTNVYKLNFNEGYVNIDKNGAVSCKNLDESTMTTYVANYNIYHNTTGALKDITAGLPFVFGTSKENRGYAGSYRDDSGAEKHWMWTENGEAPTTIYKENDVSVSYSVSWSSGMPTITGMTFDDPIIFTAAFNDSNGTSRGDDLNYEGPGQLWGINWTREGDTNGNGSCDDGESSCKDNWNPQYNITDGTKLTANDGAEWRVKAVDSWKTLADADASNCSTLPVTNSDVAYTKPTLTAVSHGWAERPTITDKVKVIHGVLQQ
jgi:hypothetical protein